VCFVIPTYNEAGNITQLLQEVLTCLDTRPGWDGQVLVVDDHSPDGTAALVRRAADNDSRIRLLEGERRGLGHAYIRGFQHALDRYDPDVLIQMDADFSHAPADSLRLLDALDIDTDVVIGSRYTNGGRVDERWGTRRLLLSRGGNLFARYVAGLRAVHDCTAGFKAIRAECLKQAAPQHLRIQGYVFQVALLHALINSGGRVKEIPVSFADRTRGHTKLSWRDVVEFFVHIWWLRLQSGRTFAKFLLTGLSGVAVNLLAFAGLLDLGVHKYLASVLAMELSIVWNFMVNNYWTFRHRHMTSRKRIRGLRFNAVSLVTLGISFLTFLLLSLGFPDTSPLLHQAIAILPGGIANYFANSYWTFRPQQ
jgi:dolichol-phosphate mannosyltransferase